MPRLDLILLPLIGGYIFLITFNITKFYHLRIERQRLIFNSIVAAFGIAAIGYQIDYWILKSECLLPYRTIISSFVSSVIGIEVPGLKHAIFFFVLSPILGHSMNLVFRRKFAFAYTIEKWGSQIDRLFWFSLNELKDENKLLMITTKSNKVYIGYVNKISEPLAETYITIIPNFSGYRNKETLKLEITTRYTDIIQKYIDEDRAKELDGKLGVILPVSEILIISKFDIEVFESFTSIENNADQDEDRFMEYLKRFFIKKG